MLDIGYCYTKAIVASEQVLQDIAKVSEDINPIHMNEKYAAHSRFGKRIMHALFCLNGISMIIGNYMPGNGAILLSQTFQYMHPVYIGDIIEITVTVIEILPKDKYVLRTLCRNQLGNIVLDGKSVVKWEEN